MGFLEKESLHDCKKSRFDGNHAGGISEGGAAEDMQVRFGCYLLDGISHGVVCGWVFCAALFRTHVT